MKHIYQRTSHDCGVAALAMFTDHTYEDMYELCMHTDNEEDRPIYVEGWGMNREYEILKRLGLWSYSSDLENAKCIRLVKQESTAPEYFRKFVWGRRALMMVPSLNIDGGHHFVCYDGQNVLDPNDPATGRKIYTKFEELLPTEIYLMRETENGRQ